MKQATQLFLGGNSSISLSEPIEGSHADVDLDLLNGYHLEPNKEAMASPRKYYKGESISAAWQRAQTKNPEKEYEGTCQKLKSKPNSQVSVCLKENINYFATQERLDFRDNFLGEKGFITILPLINSNDCFTHLNVSGNGLRNEAVCHMVDMLLRPKHSDRPLTLDLSRNPISVTGFHALAVLAARHPTVREINISRTQIPRKKILQLKDFMASKDQRAEKEAEERAYEASRRGGLNTGRDEAGEDEEDLIAKEDENWVIIPTSVRADGEEKVQEELVEQGGAGVSPDSGTEATQNNEAMEKEES